MKNSIPFIAFAALILGAFGGFYGGVQYQKNQQQPLNTAFGNRMMQKDGRTGTIGGRQQIGTIIKQDDVSVTIQLQDKSSKIILLSDQTTFTKTSEIEKTDLKIGDRIGAFGNQNADGSISAYNIQLNPFFRTVNGGAPR